MGFDAMLELMMDRAESIQIVLEIALERGRAFASNGERPRNPNGQKSWKASKHSSFATEVRA